MSCNVKRVAFALSALGLFGWVGEGRAEGTPAGTVIENMATATYNVGPATLSEDSNPVETTVAERLEVEVVWLDAAPVAVGPGDSGQITTFEVSNEGNGTDTYSLAGLSALGGDDFDPALVTIYLDTSGNGSYDVGVDDQYVAGTNDPVLIADASVIVFVSNNIPASAVENEQGFTQLTASSTTVPGGSAAPGTVITSGGDGGVDAVVGFSGGDDSGTGIYVISTVVVTITKSAVVEDQFGGTQAIPGAKITYSIFVEVTGTGTANNVVVTDDIPADTVYNTGTIVLNATGMTDVSDADAGEISGSTISVNLGNVAALSPIQTISFEVTIDPN